MKEKVEEIVFNIIRNNTEDLNIGIINYDTLLLSGGSEIDSMTIVSIIVDLESELTDFFQKEILMENGRTYIPDRLLFAKNTDEVVVIDYKTGVKRTNHEMQITEYASALHAMGYKNTKRVLMYITDEIKAKIL